MYLIEHDENQVSAEGMMVTCDRMWYGQNNIQDKPQSGGYDMERLTWCGGRDVTGACVVERDMIWRT